MEHEVNGYARGYVLLGVTKAEMDWSLYRSTTFKYISLVSHIFENDVWYRLDTVSTSPVSTRLKHWET